MYQADFVCTYKWMDNDDDQEQMYRIQMLQAFDLNEWNDDIIHKTIVELYATLGKLSEFKIIFAKARENKNIQEMLALMSLSGEEKSDTDDIIFNLLFKFEYFDLLHRCIVDYILNNKLTPKYVTNLLNDL
jgi:hypothetical protein